MCLGAIACPDRSSPNMVKDGKIVQRKQRNLCKDRRRQSIRDDPYLGGAGAIRVSIGQLTTSGSGARDVSHVLLLSLNTVLKVLQQSAAGVGGPTPRCACEI
jgi:transposase-like protein